MKAFLFSCAAVCSCWLALGCGPAPNPAPNPPKPMGGHVEHAHPEHGPHKGELVELGKEEFHLELVHDDATETLTLYVLDHEAKAAVATPEKEAVVNVVVGGQPKQFKIPAVPQATDPAGETTRFELKDKELCDVLCAKGNKSRINIAIKGQPYSGEYVAEHDHDHEKK